MMVGAEACNMCTSRIGGAGEGNGSVMALVFMSVTANYTFDQSQIGTLCIPAPSISYDNSY